MPLWIDGEGIKREREVEENRGVVTICSNRGSMGSCCRREQIEIAKYFNPAISSCECSRKIEALQKELAKSKEHAASLALELRPLTFNEECFVDDDFAKIHTGLPNAKIVKACV